jgi:membrane protein DedA with SNARE-associated domain
MSADLAQVVQDMVLKPDFTSALVLFWFSFVNELVAVLPYVMLVSGQLIFLEVGSFGAHLSKLFFLIAIPSGIGGAFGSLLIYGLAYFGGKPLIDKLKRYIRFSWDDIEKVNRRFRGAWYDEITFLALRCIPVLPSLPVSAAAGVMRMSPVSYLVLTIIGFILRMMIMFMFVGLGVETLAR